MAKVAIRCIMMLAVAALSVVSALAAETDGGVRGYYTNSVPDNAEILRGYSIENQMKRMEHLALQPIEGIWDYREEMMTVAIERFTSPQFSRHISHRIVMLESENLDLLPGTVIGYMAESADNSKYELWIYSEQNGTELSSPQHCVATLAGNTLAFKRMKELKVKVRVNFSRFLPSLFRGITVTPEIKNEPLPVGFKKRYPLPAKSDYSEDEVRYL